jgi:hypothetical protein
MVFAAAAGHDCRAGCLCLSSSGADSTPFLLIHSFDFVILRWVDSSFIIRRRCRVIIARIFVFRLRIFVL